MLVLVNLAITIVMTASYVVLSVSRGERGPLYELFLVYLVVVVITYFVDRRLVQSRRTRPGDSTRHPRVPWNYWLLTLLSPYLILSSTTELALELAESAPDRYAMFLSFAILCLNLYLLAFSAHMIERGAQQPPAAPGVQPGN